MVVTCNTVVKHPTHAKGNFINFVINLVIILLILITYINKIVALLLYQYITDINRRTRQQMFSQ